MSQTPYRLLFSSIFFCTACMLQTVHAEQTPEPVTTPDPFTIQLPVVDRKALVEQIRTLRSQLIQRKQALVEIIADKKLNNRDVIITIIMPGGLLYAGYRKVRYEQAKNEFARVSADIVEYSSDLLAMHPGPTPALVAQQP